jgi:hypothetical protein
VRLLLHGMETRCERSSKHAIPLHLYGYGNERPQAFRRPTNTVPVNAEDPIGEEAKMLQALPGKSSKFVPLKGYLIKKFGPPVFVRTTDIGIAIFRRQWQA